MKKWVVLFAFTTMILTLPVVSNAGSIGVHCWNMQPYADIICFDVNDLGFAYALNGTEHAPNSYRIPITGSANYDEYIDKIRVQFFATAPSWFVLDEATIDPATLDGTWSNSSGSSGDLIYVGSGP